MNAGTDRFNLSAWALTHRPLVLFAMLALAIIGTLSYQQLGQSEDPPFTFKVMLIRTVWPGATAREIEQQVTDKIERKLQETPHVDRVQSRSSPGESLVFFSIKDSAPAAEVANVWYQVRKKVGDIRDQLPAGIRGPYFNDEFGETYGNIYALVGAGYSYAQMKTYADRVRAELLRVPDVAKVDFFGEQEEKIFVEISNAKLANLGIDAATITNALAQQNAVSGAGAFETTTDKIYLRATGALTDPKSIAETTIRAGGRLIRLGDIAQIRRGYVDPPRDTMRVDGRAALGVGVSMAKGGDILALGRNLERTIARIQSELPVGLDLEQVSNQPLAVSRSINEFVRSLAEAVLIVLVVSFLSLGFRTGVVVALSIPLVLAATFFFMRMLDVGLHKISLGALILALGLLVDDAIIAVEMMARKMEQGWERMRAASFAYSATAFPMLSGTLVTAAGFLPIATAQSATGEYTRSIFQVTVIALLLSWIAAVVFIPYLGYYLLPDLAKRAAPTESPLYRFARRVLPFLPKMSVKPAHQVDDEDAVYRTRFFVWFRSVVEWCLRHRWVVIVTTIVLFVGSLAAFRYVPQQFFPSSTRPEILIELRMHQGTSFKASDSVVKRVEAVLEKESGLEQFVVYIGTGSPRFYLPLDQQQPQPSFAQFVITTQNLPAREALRDRLIQRFEDDFPDIRASVSRLENGPPVGFPVQYRVSGPDTQEIRRIAQEVAAIMRTDTALSNVQFDWDERSKIIALDIDQERARVLGLSSQEVALFLNSSLNGLPVTVLRDGDKSIEVLLRGDATERVYLSLLQDLAIPTRAGKSVPITQLATIRYDFEEGVVYRRDRLPTINVRANLYGTTQPATVVDRLAPEIAKIEAALPFGVRIATGGSVEESARGGKSVAAGVPLFVFVVFAVLMLQLQSFQRVLLVVLTAPLGLIGVTLFLLAFGQPFGFVAMLGTIALSGMIMRNSVILVDQIDQDIQAGHAPWRAVVEATVRRCRPIVLTALAAVIAMVPLSRSVFFGPMAVAIMGGLLVATLLTLLFLPALYAAWFRVKPAPG